MKNKEAGRNLNTAKSFYLLITLLTVLIAGYLHHEVHAHQVPAHPDEGSIITSALVENPGLILVQQKAASEKKKEIEVSRGIKLHIQSYVSPRDGAVKSLAENITSIEEAYGTALGWVYVSEQRLNQEIDKWLTPHQFLVDTVDYSANPIPGEVVSDCEEQAYTLVSLVRAIGINPHNVRVAIGEVDLGDSIEGHAWVEVLVDDEWLVLEPTSGTYWDDVTEKLINRKGVSFNYYESRCYPVIQVWIYYNDIYYFNFNSKSGNAPSSWLETNPASYQSP